MTKVLREAKGDPLDSTVATLVQSTVNANRVRFRMKFSAVHVDAANHFGALGPMIFFCAVAQTEQEFFYQTHKVRLPLVSSKHFVTHHVVVPRSAIPTFPSRLPYRSHQPSAA